MSFERELAASAGPAMPNDFWEFWDARLAAAPAGEAEVADAGLTSPVAAYEELTLPTADGTALHAHVVRPRKIEGPVPCVVSSYDMARAPRGWHHLTRWVALGCAVVQPQRRHWSGDVCAGWEQGPAGLELATQVADAALWLRATAALPFADEGRLVLYGEGLGAALLADAAALAGRVGVRVRRSCLLNPTLADFRAVWEHVGSTVTYAGLRRHFRIEDPTGEAADELFSTLDYVDTVNFARALPGDLLLGTSLMDGVTPPAVQSALYDAVPGAGKRRVTYPKWGHERVNDFEDKTLRWLNEGGMFLPSY